MTEENWNTETKGKAMSSDMMPAVDLKALELNICDAIDNIETPEDMILLTAWMGSLKNVLADAKRSQNARFMEIIKEAGGSVNCGESRYYIGEKKKIKPIGNWPIMEALLQHTEGDAEQISGCLASNAWKQGGIKTLLGAEKHKELFTTTVEQELKTGKPVKEVKQIQTNLIKKNEREGNEV